MVLLKRVFRNQVFILPVCKDKCQHITLKEQRSRFLTSAPGFLSYANLLCFGSEWRFEREGALLFLMSATVGSIPFDPWFHASLD
jgi:hypothetical protein